MPSKGITFFKRDVQHTENLISTLSAVEHRYNLVNPFKLRKMPFLVLTEFLLSTARFMEYSSMPKSSIGL
jgi:hypothetical protein